VIERASERTNSLNCQSGWRDLLLVPTTYSTLPYLPTYLPTYLRAHQHTILPCPRSKPEEGNTNTIEAGTTEAIPKAPPAEDWSREKEREKKEKVTAADPRKQCRQTFFASSHHCLYISLTPQERTDRHLLFCLVLFSCQTHQSIFILLLFSVFLSFSWLVLYGGPNDRPALH